MNYVGFLFALALKPTMLPGSLLSGPSKIKGPNYKVLGSVGLHLRVEISAGSGFGNPC